MADVELKKIFEDIEKRDFKKELEEKNELDEIGAKYSCRKCGLVMKIKLGMTPPNCRDCKANDWEFLSKQLYTKTQYTEAWKYFKDKKILDKIQKEISKNHLGDDKLKMTLFLTAVSGLLPKQELRQSVKITGETADGKNNVVRACLKHIPKDKFISVTNATVASLEDDIQQYSIVELSELNLSKENGANKHLLETLKQKAEGGTSSIKKDLRDGMKSSRHEHGEQGTIIYTTTETETDTELNTRFIDLGIVSSPEKIRAVNNNTLDTFSSFDSILEKIDAKDSIIRVGLTGFCQVFDGFQIIIPYAKYLKDFSFIDDADSRSKRDLKRILALTCAMTFIKSPCRKTCQKKGVNFIESVPDDLIDTLKISKDFFNQSYSGIDKRLSQIVDFIENHPDEWIERGEIQQHFKIKSLNTLKSFLEQLASGGMGLIEGCSGFKLNENKPTNPYHSSKVYYKTCQKGFKKSLITCQLSKLKEYLDNKIKEEKENLSVNEEKSLTKQDISEKIDTFSLTPFSKEKIDKTELSDEYNKILKIKKFDRYLTLPHLTSLNHTNHTNITNNLNNLNNNKESSVLHIKESEVSEVSDVKGVSEVLFTDKELIDYSEPKDKNEDNFDKLSKEYKKEGLID